MAKEEEKKESKKEEDKESKVYTIPLGKAANVPITKRTSKAIKLIRRYLVLVLGIAV